MIASRLATAGVAADTVARVLDDVVVDEQQQADALAAERASRLRGVPEQKAFTRLVGLLQRRGYPWEVARRAASRALALEAFED